MAQKVQDIGKLAEELDGIRGKVRRATARAMLRTANAAAAQAKRNAVATFKGTKDRPKQGFLSNSIFAAYTAKGLTVKGDRRIAEVMVAVRAQKGSRGTRPYGRIHEYGGKVMPRNAHNLWIPAFGPKSSGDVGIFKDWTPRDFMKAFLDKSRSRGRLNVKGKGKARRAVLKGRRFWQPEPQQKGPYGDFAFIWKGAGLTAGVVKRSGRGKSMTQKFIALFFLRKQVEIPARPYVTPAVEAEFPLLKERLDRELSGGK